jgi:phosphoribosylformylglycinamidine synthase
VLVSIDAARTAELMALADAHGIPATAIGQVGGDRIRISVSGRNAIDSVLADAERVWSTAIDGYFESRRAIA